MQTSNNYKGLKGFYIPGSVNTVLEHPSLRSRTGNATASNQTVAYAIATVTATFDPVTGNDAYIATGCIRSSTQHCYMHRNGKKFLVV